MPARPADDRARDYRAFVARAYDACAPAYNAARNLEDKALLPLFERLPNGARVLDLGCGAGVPIARALSARYSVVGVDISRAQLALARRQASDAAYLLADIATVAFAPASFDAVVSFYAIFHVPRDHHGPLFTRMHAWLRPGGYAMFSVARDDDGSYTEDFFGAEMYWSNYAVDDYRRMLDESGFDLLDESMLIGGLDAPGAPERHPLFLAQRR